MERASRLGPSLGPILVQLPPAWKADPPRLARFLDAAAPRAKRWAVEFRDPSWLTDRVVRILEEHRAALCIHDKIRDHPRITTAGWTYLRYHGGPGGTYSRRFLAVEAEWIRARLAEGIDVFAYFNNDIDGHAVGNAASLLSDLAPERAGGAESPQRRLL
jgi:uncharacterized protein YecE (DUF72 family)